MNHDNKNESKLLGRRRALQMLGVGVAAGGLLALEACKGNSGDAGGSSGGPGPSSANDCMTDIDENSTTLRRTLQYSEKAAVPEKHCSACAQYIDGKYGKCGGGCKVIPGAVNPNGGCLSFAPKGAAPAASG